MNTEPTVTVYRVTPGGVIELFRHTDAKFCREVCWFLAEGKQRIPTIYRVGNLAYDDEGTCFAHFVKSDEGEHLRYDGVPHVSYPVLD